MGKLTSVAAITAIGHVYAKDLQSTTAQRVESKLSSDPKMTYGQRGIGFGRNLRDNSVFTSNARNPVRNDQITRAAPRRQPSVDSDQDHLGVPEKKTGMIHSDANSHLLASHGFQSPYYPNTQTHTCVNDSML